MPTYIEQMLHEHHKLFHNPVLKLGELHYHILKSVDAVENLKKEDKEFSKEIGHDEIHWWVFYKETDLKNLKNRTKKALESFQKIKEDSIKLRDSLKPKLYSQLIESMKNFCIEHETEIQVLLDYVKWLDEKDPRAPSILFTYRVWGSTRMGDRTISISKRDEESVINLCTEIALGLRESFHGPTVGRIFNEVSYEIFESLQPEDYSNPISISEEVVITRASNDILREVAEYFEFLRNSLRNILLEIDEFETSANILHNDGFWRSFVKAVITLPIENNLWDFKETLAMWKTGGEIKKEKEVEFCEDVASFANRDGGVLIIGITNQIPRNIVGLDDLENKVKNAKDVLHNRIDCERVFTHFYPLVLKDEDDIERKCLLIVIKRVMDAVGVRNEKDQFTYPARNETGIIRLTQREISNTKIGLKHDDYQFLSTLETNYSK